MRRWIFALVLGFGAGGIAGAPAGCKEERCGERNLPGTLGCPCLPGERCATDLVCAAGTCISEAPMTTGGAGTDTQGGTQTADTGTGTGAGTAGPGTAASGAGSAGSGTAASGTSTGG